MAKPCYNDDAWRRFRIDILVRDRYVCQLRMDGCTIRATAVDHIVELDAGGRRLDPANAQATCRHCNSVKAALYVQRKGRPPTVVAPAPPSREW